MRSFAVVLLRRVGFKTFKEHDDSQTIWEGSAQSTKEQVKAALLECYEKEHIVTVRNKICDTMADIGRDAEEQSRKYQPVEKVDLFRTLARTFERAHS